MSYLLRWAVGVVAILATVQVMKALPPQYGLEWRSVWGMVVFVPVFALVNAVVGSILRLLSLPITCVTFGLFGFVINAIVFYVAGSATGARAIYGRESSCNAQFYQDCLGAQMRYSEVFCERRSCRLAQSARAKD